MKEQCKDETMNRIKVLVAVAAMLAAGAGVAEEKAEWRQGDFAAKLYRQMAKGNGNLAFSPYGVASVCALVGSGAKGETAEAFKNTLGLSTDNPDEIARIFRETKQKLGNAVEISDSVWLFRGFRPCDEYRTRAVCGFLAEARNALCGVAAMREINAYVSDKTHGKIPILLRTPPNPLTRMVAVNAVYIKAKWAQTFDKKMTRSQVFTTLSGGEVMVPFMRGLIQATYFKGQEFSSVSLQYVGSAVEMAFILPNKGVALQQIEEELSESFINRVVLNDMFKPSPDMSAEEVRRWKNKRIMFARREESVEIQIPRFEFEMRYDLGKPLCGIGLGVAFSDKADFSGLAAVKPGDLRVSDVEQVVKIKVDEEGTEAGAATSMLVREYKCGGLPSPPRFIADHPFVFVLWDRASGAILFMGRVMNPEEKVAKRRTL